MEPVPHQPRGLLDTTDADYLARAERAVADYLGGDKYKKYARFIIAALGSLSWVGGVLAAATALNAEVEQEKTNELQRLWLLEHQGKLRELAATLQEIFGRLDGFGEEAQERIQSPQYLMLVRKTFRAWDQVDTMDKRQMLKKIITNAGAITLCPDDLIRLFIDWVERYHEAHFVVIKEIYQRQPISRGAIWDIVHPEGRPTDSSAEAGLFGYLIRELSLGGVIHQQKRINYDGEYMRAARKTQHKPRSDSDTMESPFEDTKPYVLTELGKEFVRYVMEDVVPQIGEARN